MADLFKYFTPEAKCLPDPQCPLSKEIPSISITAANSEVEAAMQIEETCGNEKKQCGHYQKHSPEIKAELGKYSSINGVTATLHRCSKTYPGLNESSIRMWRDVYRFELKRKLQSVPMNKKNEVDITQLPQKKTGRPYLLGDALDEQVRRYILCLREKGAVISTDIVISCARGIIKNEDCRILACNGGPIEIMGKEPFESNGIR